MYLPADERLRDGGVGRVAQGLQLPGSDEAATGEHPGHRHRARIEVVVLVPAVVRVVVTLVGLDHGDQRRADRRGVRPLTRKDRVLALGGLGTRVVAQRNVF